MTKTIIIGGVGTHSNYSKALIEASVQHGYAVLALARSKHGKEELVQHFAGKSHVVFKWLNLTDEAALDDALFYAEQNLGPVTAYIHNATKLVLKPFLETEASDFQETWQACVESAITASRTVLPRLQRSGCGSLIFLGATASVRGSSGAAPFATAKFALRALSQSLAREFGPEGIHVAHMIIDGIISGDRAQNKFGLKHSDCIESVELAKATLSLLQQNPSCWTQELDLRPFCERF